MFVASCYSQFAGEIFHNAGAKHVICIERGEKIRDDASIIFSQAFYLQLFSQTTTVCKAFEFAKEILKCHSNKAIANEYHKFILLKDDEEIKTDLNNINFAPSVFKPAKKHQCQIFGPFKNGNIECLNEKPLFPLEISKIEDFLGRKAEMQDVLSNVRKQRLVTIKGIPGIGKTTLAKAVAYYFDER